MVITEDDLAGVRLQHKGQRIVLGGGGFDLLHVGHLDYLKFSKAQGDILVVGLAGDLILKQRKGGARPIIPEKDRARMLDSLRCVDYVFVVDEDLPPRPTIRAAETLQPDVITFFSDVPEQDIIVIQGKFPKAKIVVDTQSKIESTTDIIKRIVTSDEAAA
jgi:D-beta-D-heptose 7-phosphate kinase/D-beta-D-heptose 1-phosphate adenosyltransferase